MLYTEYFKKELNYLRDIEEDGLLVLKTWDLI